MAESMSIGAAEVRAQATRRDLLRFGRHFDIGSLAVILLAALLLGVLFDAALIRHVEHTAAENNVVLSHVIAIGVAANDVLEEDGKARLLQRFNEYLPDLVAGQPVLKIKLYDGSGLTLFSTNKVEVGEQEDAGERFLIARAGQPSSKLYLADDGPGAHFDLAGKSFVETYMPLRERDGNIHYVFELYYDVSDDITYLKKIKLLLIGGMLAILLLVYAFLIALVRPADRAIRRQLADHLRLYGAIRNAPVGIFVTEATRQDNPVIFVNPAFAAETGISMEDASGQDISRFIMQFGDIQSRAALNRALTNKTPVILRQRMGEEGNLREKEVHIAPVLDEDSKSTFFVGFIVDVNERVEAERKNALLASAVEQTSDMVVITNTEGVIEYVNPRFSQITGFDSSEALGRTPRLLKSGETTAESYGRLWQTISNGLDWEGEILNRKKNGALYWEHQIISPVRDETGKVTHYVAVKEDISTRKEAEAKIERLALYDNLTGLPNRFHFQDRLRRAIIQARSRRRGALLFLDLDDFKGVNDTLGHPVGDGLLFAVAKRLSESVREGDFIARIGGDEFAVLAEAVDNIEDVAQLAENIIAAVDRPFLVDGNEVFVGISIGISIFPDDSKSGDQLLRNADLALYRCKNDGTNLYHFYRADMDAEVLENKLLAQDLRSALERHELRLHYQPILDLDNEQVVALEVLLRWEHREKGPISPAQFIPIAERTRLIVPIGDWVLAEACRQTARWQEAGIAVVPVAVNVSLVQFGNRDLAKLVADVLAKTGLTADLLHIEITESVAMERTSEILETLERLRNLGVQISLDDFGTGYSSLSRLRHLPIDRLKVDQSFLKELDRDAPSGKSGSAVIEAIVGLGRSLGMRIVVEGVEHPHHVAHLKRMGSAEVQGYLFSRPLPAAQCEAFLRSAQMTTG